MVEKGYPNKWRKKWRETMQTGLFYNFKMFMHICRRQLMELLKKTIVLMPHDVGGLLEKKLPLSFNTSN